MTYSFLRNLLGTGFAPESRLTSCGVFRKTASMGGRNRLQHKHAAICFAVVSLYTLVCGLGCLALPFVWHHVDPTAPFMWAVAIDGITSCILAAFCAWAAWALSKRTPRAGLIAVVTWLLVGVLTVWCLLSVAWSGWDLVGILIVAILAALELLIGFYLLKPTTRDFL